MKLLELSSSNPKFKTLVFNNGLNIVSGVQLTAEEKKTFNGIGKSLSLKMLHYMFGGSFKGMDELRLLEYLKGYGQFTLKFSHKEVKYEISKNFAESFFYIGDQKVSKTNYPKELNKIFLQEGSPVKFKQMFNVFARKFGGGQYNHILSQQGRPLEDFHQRLANYYLLRLNTFLVLEKAEIKDLIEASDLALKAISNYEKSIEVNTRDIEEEISKLSTEKDHFVIAENYDELKGKADDLTKMLNGLRTELFDLKESLERKISNFEASENVNIDVNEITSIFEEARFFFDSKVTKRLEDAQLFHNSLVSARKEKLKEEISGLELHIESLQSNIKKTGTERDSILKDLDSKGALEEYNSLSERIKTLSEQKNNAERYQSTLNNLKQERADLDIRNSTLHKRSLVYLDQNKVHFEKIESTFRSLVKEFYDTLGVHFKISETQNAKYLFDLDVFVPKEGSQGVNEVKIFCYDTLLFLMNQDLLGFMAHDGCIFSGMDPRQKAMIFKVVLKLISNHGLQYYININENSLNEILNGSGILSDDEKAYIKNSQILKLTDKDPKSWLFGESFN